MAINLKQISILDTDEIKLDKVNYNFDQLVANGGGPQGVPGPAGSTGYQGTTGNQGDQGISGDQGDQGPSGDTGAELWIQNPANPINGVTTKTLLPEHDPNQTNTPSTVAVGYDSTSSFYQSGVESNASLVINRSSDVINNNLELRTEDEGSATSFYYKGTNDINGNSTMQTGFRGINGNAVYDQIATEFQWTSADSTNMLMSINDSSLDVKIASNFNEPVTINGDLIIGGTTTTPDVGSIAVSVDAFGKVDFKTIEEIGGVVPIGTIVSVAPTFYNTSNFILSETGVTAAADAPIEIRVGSGINTFAGWYLCNGKTWLEPSSGTTSLVDQPTGHVTPDLNSFSYEIDDNPATIDLNSQGLVDVQNTDVHIIGGSDAYMAADYSNSSYDITGSIQTSTQPVSTDSQGTTFKIKRLPQIIYLGEENLYWKDKGTGQADDVTVTYKLTDTTGTVSEISVVKTEEEGSSFNFSANLAAPSLYEWIGVPTFTSNNSSTTATSPSFTVTSASSIPVNIYVGVQQQGGTVNITYSSADKIQAIPETTIVYPYQGSDFGLTAFDNAFLSSAHFLGNATTGNQPATLTSAGITGDNGTTYYTKYIFTKDLSSCVQDWNQFSPGSITISNLSNVTVESSVRSSNGKTMTFILKETNWGSSGSTDYTSNMVIDNLPTSNTLVSGTSPSNSNYEISDTSGSSSNYQEQLITNCTVSTVYIRPFASFSNTSSNISSDDEIEWTLSVGSALGSTYVQDISNNGPNPPELLYGNSTSTGSSIVIPAGENRTVRISTARIFGTGSSNITATIDFRSAITNSSDGNDYNVIIY